MPPETQSTEGAPTDAPVDQPVPNKKTGETANTPDDYAELKAAIAKERDARAAAEKRVKELSPYEQKVKEAEDANKSEVQKATEALAVERDARSKAETSLLRYEVGSAKGVPASLIKFLVGDTKEAVEEAADALLAELGTKDPAPGIPGRPQERMVNGQPSNPNLDGMDPMDLISMGRDQRKTR
jgi:hypothetical protein